MYSRTVFLCGLCIFIFLGKLNDLEVWVTDITSASLEAFTAKKVCLYAGAAFGKLKSYFLIIDKVLYGLYSSRAHWHNQLANSFRSENFFPC